MSFALFFDVIVAGLLIATIVFAVLLNRRLAMIHNSREEIQALLDHFSKSLSRAEDGISELKRAANFIGDGLDVQVKKAILLKDDLGFLIERADALADRLEDGVRNKRTLAAKPAEDSPKSRNIEINLERSKAPEMAEGDKMLGGLR